DDADRSALGEGPDRREEAVRHRHIDAAGVDDLQGLPAALGVEKLDLEVRLLEEALLLGEFEERTVPEAALRDRDLELVGRLGERGGRDCPGCEGGENDQAARQHGLSPPGRRFLGEIAATAALLQPQNAAPNAPS